MFMTKISIDITPHQHLVLRLYIEYVSMYSSDVFRLVLFSVD